MAGAARPRGTVTFEVDDYYEGVTVTAQVGPDGTASAVVPGFTGNATRDVLATYSGDARHEPGHGSGTHESLRTATTVEVLSGSWNIYGQMLPIRVQVRSAEPSPEAPTGDVSIRLDGRTLGTAADPRAELRRHARRRPQPQPELGARQPGRLAGSGSWVG